VHHFSTCSAIIVLQLHPVPHLTRPCAGSNIARVWLFSDGRAAPTFDAADRGLVVSLNEVIYTQLHDMLEAAANHGIKVCTALANLDVEGDCVDCVDCVDCGEFVE
jgi:hypothetical protein